jgi:DNA-binding response OmpR family regulator
MRILVVEDEKKIARDLTEGLTDAGYVVDTVHDGDEAWFKGETEDYDAIVLDLGLPRLDGISVIRRLRQARIVTPVIILTARGSWMERVEGIDAGADDYLVKPFHMEELIARVGAVLRRSGGHASPQLVAGGLTIDTRRMTALVAGKSVALSALEYRLLRYLAHHAGRIVSQTELAEHVYGGDREPDSNALEVLVARLRRKIGADVIETRRGHGYVVAAAKEAEPCAPARSG